MVYFFSNFTYSHSVVHHWEYLATEKNQEGSVPWSLRSLGQLETHSMRLQYHVIVQCTVTMYTNEILRSSLNTVVVNWSYPCFWDKKSL